MSLSQDTELGSKRIKKGDKVVKWYISGDRDTEVIGEPERLHSNFVMGITKVMDITKVMGITKMPVVLHPLRTE